MSTVRITAKEFLADVRDGVDDCSLMIKYRLSAEQLQRVFGELIEMDLLTENGLRMRTQLSDTEITRSFMDLKCNMRKVK